MAHALVGLQVGDDFGLQVFTRENDTIPTPNIFLAAIYSPAI